MKSNFNKCLLLLLSACLLYSCNKEEETILPNKTSNFLPGQIPGMGETSGALTGTAYIFPEGITLTGNITGDFYLAPQSNYCQTVGSGAFVAVCLRLVNRLDKDTLIILPAGLTFRADRPDDQNGMLIRNTTIFLNKEDSCNVLLYTYCINQERHPSLRSSTYTLGPVTDAEPCLELIDLLKNKKINKEEVDSESYLDLKYKLQHIVWHITDGKGISTEDEDYIRTLKNI